MRVNEATASMLGNPGRLLRPKEVSERLGIGRTKTYELIASGQLRVTQLGERCKRVSEEELYGYINKSTMQSPQGIR